MPPATETHPPTHARCTRCEARVHRTELQPCPTWQEKPGVPVPLPVPGFVAGKDRPFAAVPSSPSSRYCRDCRVRIIQRRRYERHDTAAGETAHAWATPSTLLP